ncbi:hypothetical protein M413DRAFT_398217 [Hebeloma cylindrosporum]|uniref:MYND-type domain-containing protein n=1 Tax=Hebeloma cylindrosporum TaxID=76867 RepID=A0A0C2Y038_HEBCY|nr:hypothetical protein M413DRAFT_398217 [Hebeloma cylindrosporum h7]
MMKIPEWLDLVPHATARDKCIAKTSLNEGSCIFTEPAFTTILLPSEKGQRCDNCFRLPSGKVRLQRCTGCGSYWYCDTQCQAFQWRAHHKRICKGYNTHLSSPEYQALPVHEKNDSILLTHTLAKLSLLTIPYSVEDSPSATVLLSLLPHPQDSVPPPVCPIKPTPQPQLLKRLYARFGNNNFAIHSRLTTVGHGVFPVASRLFNHSCVPNAVAKYVFSSSQSIVMEVVALRDISPEEEVCLPYLDPALHESRRQILEISYGFKCQCPSCLFLQAIGPLPELPIDQTELSFLEKSLRDLVGFVPDLAHTLPERLIEDTPPSLYCMLREGYMAGLSETFSKASHEGQYDVALESGVTLLSLYLLVYPPNYPQTGMHLLELAKTAWNAIITARGLTGDEIQMLKQQLPVFLSLARHILTILGPEDDGVGPLQEIQTLQQLLPDI